MKAPKWATVKRAGDRRRLTFWTDLRGRPPEGEAPRCPSGSPARVAIVQGDGRLVIEPAWFCSTCTIAAMTDLRGGPDRGVHHRQGAGHDAIVLVAARGAPPVTLQCVAHPPPAGGETLRGIP